MRLQHQPSDTELESQLASWNPMARQKALATLENYDDSLASLKIAHALLARRRTVDRIFPTYLMVWIAFAFTLRFLWPRNFFECVLFGGVTFFPLLGLSRLSFRLNDLARWIPKEPSQILTKPLIDLLSLETKPQEGDMGSADWNKINEAACSLVARIDEETARSLTPRHFAWIRKEVALATGLEDSPKSVAFLVGALLALAEGDGSSIPDAVHLARTHVSEQVRAAAAECARRLGSQDDLSYVSGQEATANAAKQRG